MGAIATAFTNAFVDASNVSKANCRALGTTIEAYFVSPWTWSNNTVASPTSAPSGYISRMVGKDADTYQGIVIDSFGGIPNLRLRRANGTGAAPTAVVSGNNVGEIEFAGYYTSVSAAYAQEAANIRASATENWTSTTWGCQLVFQTTPTGSATPADALWVGQDKSLLAGGAIGYQTAVSAGGTVTQGTSRTTGVTLNKPTGEIVIFSATSGTAANFTVTNSFVGANDTVVVCHKSGSVDGYSAGVFNVAAGSFKINAAALGITPTTESYKLQFTVIKGATS